MAAGLGISSIRADGVKALYKGPGKSVRDYFADIENWRTLLLIGIIILYVIVTQQIAFDLRFPTKWFFQLQQLRTHFDNHPDPDIADLLARNSGALLACVCLLDHCTGFRVPVRLPHPVARIRIGDRS